MRRLPDLHPRIAEKLAIPCYRLVSWGGFRLSKLADDAARAEQTRLTTPRSSALRRGGLARIAEESARSRKRLYVYPHSSGSTSWRGGRLDCSSITRSPARRALDLRYRASGSTPQFGRRQPANVDSSPTCGSTSRCARGGPAALLADFPRPACLLLGEECWVSRTGQARRAQHLPRLRAECEIDPHHNRPGSQIMMRALAFALLLALCSIAGPSVRMIGRLFSTPSSARAGPDGQGPRSHKPLQRPCGSPGPARRLRRRSVAAHVWVNGEVLTESGRPPRIEPGTSDSRVSVPVATAARAPRSALRSATAQRRGARLLRGDGEIVCARPSDSSTTTRVKQQA